MNKNGLFKVILLLVCSFIGISSLMAQVDRDDLVAPEMKRHEVKLNALSTILLQHPEVAYEYTLNQDLSVGGRVGFSINNDMEYLPSFKMMPYVRWHFYTGGTKYAHSLRGFFAEVNTSLSNYKWEEGNKRESKTLLGMGVGIGYKYVSRLNWVVETSLIAGRNFTAGDIGVIYTTFTLSIGKRF